MFSVSYQSFCNFMCFVFRDEGNEQMTLYEIELVSNQYVSGNQKLYTYQATCYSCIVRHIDTLKCKFPTLKLSTHIEPHTYTDTRAFFFIFFEEMCSWEPRDICQLTASPLARLQKWICLREGTEYDSCNMYNCWQISSYRKSAIWHGIQQVHW